ncbi:unnamed protein product [Rotaria magnacalcarata]|uniref:MULE transposase domain-containing protein n=1 Tax=Rotaria magnacalcarata TaxID=392030 RepID=A0A819KM13_9BILA|nr:unnamed protein product [Rotaria magnacalcarata]CAF3951686.1 unnamed protein product [Rotaria magnacalcarata]
MLKQTTRRQRQTPATTSTDDLTDDLRKTYRGEDFLLHEEKDMIIFTTKSCLFHFGQSVWRHVRNKELSTKYKEDEHFGFNVKMLIGLAYLSLSDVITGFDIVASEFDDDADDLFDYFEKTWISEPRGRGAGRKKPQFDHVLRNVYDRVITNLPQSNNSVEGWHNAFTSRVTVAHPTIKKLVEKIRREQSKFEIDIAHLLQDHQLKPNKVCYRKLDERIARLVRGYDPLQIHQYLKNIAANVSL